MNDIDDISADLILLESQWKGLVNTLEKLQCEGCSSSVSLLALQCRKIRELSSSIQSGIRTRFDVLRYKEIEIENRLKDLELRENELGKRSKFKLDEVLIGEGSSLLGLKFIVSDDGERLLMFLNAHENEHEKLADEVYNVLKMSNNPGKLGFMEQRNVGVDTNVERRSCLVLLEALMRARPGIKKGVKKQAIFVAKAWKIKKGMQGEDDMEILLFLMLESFKRVAQHKQASLLGHSLGLFEKAAPDSCILHSQVKMEQLGEVSNVMSEAIDDTKINSSSPSSADLRFIASTDADRIGDDVYNALKTSGKPAKLVLNVVKAGISERANIGVQRGVVKNSCVILLEQLMRLRPVISQKLRRKALGVAQQWKGNIKDNGIYDKEILVFLMLVGAYGLTSEFNIKEIESLFKSVSQHKQAPILSPILGFIDQTFVRDIYHSQVKIEQSEADNFQLDSSIPSEPKFDQHIDSSSTRSWPELKFLSINMNATGLTLFLSEHMEDHNLMRGEISNALLLASDPAKLVLDASSFFYRSKSGDGFKGIALSNARKSCILLLEQLVTCSVQIEPHVNEEALKLAVEWKERMDEKYPQGVMAYGFLQFIITYQLKSSYNVDELLCLLVIGSEYRQSPDLCLALGLADKISMVDWLQYDSEWSINGIGRSKLLWEAKASPGLEPSSTKNCTIRLHLTVLIETLINKNLRLEAIAYICAFDLADKFPPAHLLNAHLKYSKMRKYRKGKKSNMKLNETIDQEIAIMRRVIRCIADHKLESLYPPQDLENYILHLERQKELGNDTAQREKQKAEKNKDLPIPLTKAKMQQDGCTKPFASAGGNLHLKPSPLEQPVSPIADQSVPCSLWGSAAFCGDTSSFNWQHGCEIGDPWSLEHFTSTRAVDKAAPESSIHHAQVKIDQCQSDNFHSDAFVPSEAKFKHYTTCSSTSYGVDLQYYSTSMDAMGLILFLCKHVEDHNFMRCEISDALQLAPDPARLVLDAISTFNKPESSNTHEKKWNGFNSGNLCHVRKSCILLLEQLRTFPFQIDPHVNEEVLKLAFDWKERALKGVVAYGFLQLIVTYSLISGYEADELFGLLVIASEYHQSPALCLALGLTDKIHVLIETLVKKNLRLEAIGYICALDLLIGIFDAECASRGQKSHWKPRQIRDKKKGAVGKVIGCIADHKLEKLFPRKKLENYIRHLEKQNADANVAARKEKQKTGRKKTPKAPSANTKPQHESGTKLPSPTSTSTTGSTTKLSPLQLLETFFADQAVSHGLRDSATFSATSNLLSDNQQTDVAAINDDGNSD
ncbi:hypothetical protein CXB51_028761 [Gossypium anomalum]|uniref:FRIGIDA-like protein n=1 Tax=Gossypium anomalum TaxID=47600 RepID=A0A8J6CPX3_9ROSI|nr:hypothetical protein CXB51_028761 [Gossypium anomalum]